MLGLGLSEILFLLVLALIVIGPKQLPEVARNIGRMLNEFRRSTAVFAEDMKSQVQVDLKKSPEKKNETGIQDKKDV